MKIDSTRKAIGYLLAVFIVGLAIGTVGGFTLGIIVKSQPPSAAKLEADIFKGLKSKLNLRAEQEPEVRSIVHETVGDVVITWTHAFTETSNAFIVCQQRLNPLLDVEQRVVLTNIVNEAFKK